MHSLWARGAPGAANVGVRDRLYKRHDCWRLETAKDGYVKRFCIELNTLSGLRVWDPYQ